MSNIKPDPAVIENKVSEKVVNDFCMTFSTVNGSGSATANILLLKSLFRMGIPVCGNNIFPSNIQGLPTWYSIRLSKDGYLARVDMDDIVVLMNPATVASEIEYIKPGGVIFYSDDIKLNIPRDDIIVYPMPVRALVKNADIPPNLQDYIANMVYVGAIAQMIGIDFDILYDCLDAHFEGKKKAVDSNWGIIKAASDWTAQNLEKRDPYIVESMPNLDGFIMTDGNTASALGAIYGGVQFAAWYPITPATSLAESLNEYLPKLRTDPETGKATYAVVQAEDELAAIGMAVGAGWAGLRAMTSTSGPGLSLMAEYLGLAYYAEVPLVVWDVQRVGPSTGLPTRTAQGDLTFANFISHGDTQFVILLPSDVNECFKFGWQSFEIAERLQTPVIIMTDLDLGMNIHMTRKFEYPDKPIDRGKVLWEEDLDKFIAHHGGWGRYRDVDGDGIPYRTLPGNRHPASGYFARGTGHDEYTRYTEDPAVWEQGLERLKKKIEDNKALLPPPVIYKSPAAKIGLIGFGSTDSAIQEARDLLAAQGISTNYMRICSLPFRDEIRQFLQENERIYVIELNRDGQMRQLLTMYFSDYGFKLRQISHIDGMPITARWVCERFKLKEEANQ